MKPRKRLAFLLAVLALLSCSRSALAAADSAQPDVPWREVEELATRFLKAFENLDLEAFMDCFAPDATVFFPTPEPPQRFDGKPAVRDHFREVFAAIRKGSTATGPPFHRLEPKDLEIQVLDSDTAIVTFHLRNAERIARRTLVVSRRNGVWLVRHLHASNVPIPPVTPGAPAAPPVKVPQQR